MKRAALALLVTFAIARPAAAEELKVAPARDVPIFAGSVVVAVTMRLLQDRIVATCYWCDRDPSGREALNVADQRVREALKWSEPQAAMTTSNVLAFVVAPSTAVAWTYGLAAHDGHPTRYKTDLIAIGEAVALDVALNQTAKVLLRRERPYAHVRKSEEREKLFDDEDAVSHYSGHTSLTFTLAVSAGTIASLRHYPAAPFVWASGLGVAATTGYLRIAADRHYFSDVVVGALIGSAIGATIPLLYAYSGSHERASTSTTNAAKSAPLVSWSTAF